MLKFIVCEDNSDFLTNNCQIINQVMIKNNIEYKILRFADYNPELKKVIKQDGPKIYVIDLELPTTSGIDLIREIRKTDFYSQIIISSAHDELSDRVFKGRFMTLDFISKYDNHEFKLKETIEYAISILGKRNVLTLGTKNNLILIDTNDILYILKENKSHRCTIKTKCNEVVTNSSLCTIKKQIKNDFVYSNRCCLINPKHIASMDYKNSVITFKNGECIKNMISRTYKQGLLEIWK